MDKIIRTYKYIHFDELNYCHENGVMYQVDMSKSIAYDENYFQKYVKLEDMPISIQLNKSRISLTHKYCDCILDVGIGSGEFIKKSTAKMYGYDINPIGIKWLKERGIYIDPYDTIPNNVEGLTLWDVIEHIPDPSRLLYKIPTNMYVFVALPIFHNLLLVRKSKHYKPNEHYYYWTANGLIQYFSFLGFETVEISDSETLAGREEILTFVFIKKKYVPL